MLCLLLQCSSFRLVAWRPHSALCSLSHADVHRPCRGHVCCTQCTSGFPQNALTNTSQRGPCPCCSPAGCRGSISSEISSCWLSTCCMPERSPTLQRSSLHCPAFGAEANLEPDDELLAQLNMDTYDNDDAEDNTARIFGSGNPGMTFYKSNVQVRLLRAVRQQGPCWLSFPCFLLLVA